MPDYVLRALFVFCGLMLLALTGEIRGRTLRRGLRAVLHALAGLTGLLTANTLGSLVGVGLGVNGFTCAVSALLGLPGVGLLFGLRYLVYV